VLVVEHRRDVAVLLARVPAGDLAQLRDLLGTLARTIDEDAA
jgi:hypothetical protein